MCLRSHTEDLAFREAVRRSIDNQREHFDSLALQLGYIYGEPKSVPKDVSAYKPVFRRGARMPHSWVQREEATIFSLDLVSDTEFTLFVPKEDDTWTAAANCTRMPIILCRAGLDFTDPDGNWLAQSGLEGGGALLVRSDGHIALQASDRREARQRLTEVAMQYGALPV